MRTRVIKLGRETLTISYSRHAADNKLILGSSSPLPCHLTSPQARRLAVTLVRAAIEIDVAEIRATQRKRKESGE